MNNDKFYENLGSYFVTENDKEDYIDKNINSKLFNEIKINIILVGVGQPDTPNCYEIRKIEVKNKDSFSNSKTIDTLLNDIEVINRYLKESNEKGGYKGNGTKWHVFYLLKELITTCQKLDYNYYRGQAENWPLIPSVFRNRTNASKKHIYQEFERIYKSTSREFPEELNYISLHKKNIDKRADELAILQHYGFPTTLIDITANPFIAMMFMCCFGKINHPQFKCYHIDIEDDLSKTLVSFVNKSRFNKRIRAQRGAFLNYDKLYYLSDFRKNGLIPKEDYKKIDMITFQIDFSSEKIDKKKESNIKGNENIIHKTKEDLINNFFEYEDDYYKVLREELVSKLEEYGYYSNNLFPDFGDYIKYQSQQFKQHKVKSNKKMSSNSKKEISQSQLVLNYKDGE